MVIWWGPGEGGGLQGGVGERLVIWSGEGGGCKERLVIWWGPGEGGGLQEEVGNLAGARGGLGAARRGW